MILRYVDRFWFHSSKLNRCILLCNGKGGAKWHRDPTVPLEDKEITRFPHAILEVRFCFVLVFAVHAHISWQSFE